MPQPPRRLPPLSAAAHTPETLMAHIRALEPNLAPAEQRVAAEVVRDPAAAAAKTISDLAAQCRTSGATVHRFCRAVGFDGYRELRLPPGPAAEAARAHRRRRRG